MPQPFHDFSFPIMTPRLMLRPPQLADTAAVKAGVIESLSELSIFMPWAREEGSLLATETFIRDAMANWILQKSEEPWFPIFIFDRATQEFIGGTGYHHIDWDVPCLEIGYWVRTSKSGNGYITEAVNALTRYAVQELKMRRIAICCDVKNVSSRKVAERLDFLHEATLKQSRVLMDGEISDTLIFVRHSTEGLPELEVTW
jgi:RimJ/RimL family protein N-acetyltransferase